MIDAYTIGITLALDNGISAGIATIRSDLTTLDSAVNKSQLSLDRLGQAAAQIAGQARQGLSLMQHPAAAPTVTGRDKPQLATPAVSTVSDPPAAVSPPLPLSAVILGKGRHQVSRSTANIEPSASPMSQSPSPATPLPSLQGLSIVARNPANKVDRVQRAEFTSAASSQPSERQRKNSFIHGETESFPNSGRPSGQELLPPGYAIRHNVIFSHVAGEPISALSADAPTSRHAAVASAPTHLPIPAVSGPGAVSLSTNDAIRPVRPALKNSEAGRFLRKPDQQPAAPLSVSRVASMPSSVVPSYAPNQLNSPQVMHISGDVHLDGIRVGRWISDYMAREAARPEAGATGFDSRQALPPHGSSIGAF